MSKFGGLVDLSGDWCSDTVLDAGELDQECLTYSSGNSTYLLLEASSLEDSGADADADKLQILFQF